MLMKKAWSVEFLDDVVEAEFLAMPKDLQARLVRIADLIESHAIFRISSGRYAVKAGQGLLGRSMLLWLADDWLFYGCL